MWRYLPRSKKRTNSTSKITTIFCVKRSRNKWQFFYYFPYLGSQWRKYCRIWTHQLSPDIDVLISYRFFFTVIQGMESNRNIGHFFLDCVTPKSVVIFLVAFVRLFDQDRYLHTQLMGIIEGQRSDLSDYVISLLQIISYPPSKGGFFRNSIPYNMFVWFLEILQWGPRCATIFP